MNHEIKMPVVYFQTCYRFCELYGINRVKAIIRMALAKLLIFCKNMLRTLTWLENPKDS